MKSRRNKTLDDFTRWKTCWRAGKLPPRICVLPRKRCAYRLYRRGRGPQPAGDELQAARPPDSRRYRTIALPIYNALRPYRSTKEGLLAIADDLEKPLSSEDLPLSICRSSNAVRRA